MSVKAGASTTKGVVGFQRIDGFGCSIKPFDNTDMFGGSVVTVPAEDQTDVLTFLYQDMGLSRMRTYVRGTASVYQIEETNDNADPQVTDEAALNFSRIDASTLITAAARPLGLNMTWYSPVNRPTWMGAGSADITTSVAEYAEWILAMARRSADQGDPVQQISVGNEPSHNRNFLTGATMRDVIKEVAPRLDAEGLLVPFIISDDIRASDTNSTVAPILADPVARSYVGAIASHCYDQSVSANWPALAATAAQYDLPLWMTEFSTFALPTTGQYPSSAIGWASFMHDLLVNYNVSAIDYLWGWFGEEDSAQLVRLDHTGTTYDGHVKLDVAYHMGQYSKFVRPGSRRQPCTASDASKVSAFVDDDSRVIVAVNNTGSALTPTITCPQWIAGLGTMAAVRSSTSEQWATLADVTVTGETISPNLPANSVTTFIGTP